MAEGTRKDERTVACKVTGDEWTKLSLAATAEGQRSVGSYMKTLIDRALSDKETVGRVRKLFGIEGDEHTVKAPAKRSAASPTEK